MRVVTVEEWREVLFEGPAVYAFVRERDWTVISELQYPQSVSIDDRNKDARRCYAEYHYRGAAGTQLVILDVGCSACGATLKELEKNLFGCNDCGGMFDATAIAMKMSKENLHDNLDITY